MTELILSGHSFGGMTMIYTSSLKLKQRVKALWLFDPWLFPYKEEIISGKLRTNVATSMTNSEWFIDDLQK
jgi:hypothetical protein